MESSIDAHKSMIERDGNIDWDIRFGFPIHDVSRLQRTAFDRCLRHLNVTRSQWGVLFHLAQVDGMTQTHLAAQLDAGKVAITGMIDRLEKSRLVRREPHTNDRRAYRIFLEPGGKQLLQKIRKACGGLSDQILAGLHVRQLEELAETLEVVKRNLIAHEHGAKI
jgi:DNA-binding MarR family transcriptional regulator